MATGTPGPMGDLGERHPAPPSHKEMALDQKLKGEICSMGGNIHSPRGTQKLKQLQSPGFRLFLQDEMGGSGTQKAEPGRPAPSDGDRIRMR